MSLEEIGIELQRMIHELGAANESLRLRFTVFVSLHRFDAPKRNIGRRVVAIFGKNDHDALLRIIEPRGIAIPPGDLRSNRGVFAGEGIGSGSGGRRSGGGRRFDGHLRERIGPRGRSWGLLLGRTTNCQKRNSGCTDKKPEHSVLT